VTLAWAQLLASEVLEACGDPERAHGLLDGFMLDALRAVGAGTAEPGVVEVVLACNAEARAACSWWACA
jgi:hypothetical protein